MRRIIGLLAALGMLGGCAMATGSDSEGNDMDDCGNGVVEAPEECDQTDLAGASCQTLGYAAGTLSCADNCVLDVSLCTAGGAGCGNGVLDEFEECDLTELGGYTCADVVPGSNGTLACTDLCHFDSSGCGSGICGDSSAEGLEECDAPDLRGETCASLGFAGGALDCHDACVYDTSGCSG